MNTFRYALTAMPMERDAVRILLNWHISDPNNTGLSRKDYPHFQKFVFYRISNGVFRSLQHTGFSILHRVSEFASIPPVGTKGYATLCTNSEFAFAQARKLFATRGAVAIHWLKATQHPMGMQL